MGLGALMILLLGVTVREDYNFVDTEDGESAGYVTAEGGF
jgi:hypothetical protein